MQEMYTKVPSIISYSTVCALLLLLVLFAPAAAQQGQSQDGTSIGQLCPRITIDCPTEVNDAPVFVASVQSLPKEQGVTYTWSVANARIVSGQGTPVIRVEMVKRKDGAGGTVTATITVGGLAQSCSNSASCTMIWDAPSPVVMFDSYGVISVGEENKRLDKFAAKLRGTQGATARLVAYGRSRGRVERARAYLIEGQGVETGRISVSLGGAKLKSAIELYIVPPGTLAPEAKAQ